jgi:hypothetical protein
MRLPALLGRRFRIDFASRPQPVLVLSWLLLALGVAGAALAALDVAPRWQLHQRLLAQRAELEQQLQLAGGTRAAPRLVSVADQAAAHAVLAELQRPWRPLFDRFESVNVPQVYLIQLSVDSSFRDVQLLAEAARLDDVLSYSKKLAGDRTVRTVRLTHHEWRNAPIGRVVVANLTAELASEDDRVAGGSQ